MVTVSHGPAAEGKGRQIQTVPLPLLPPVHLLFKAGDRVRMSRDLARSLERSDHPKGITIYEDNIPFGVTGTVSGSFVCPDSHGDVADVSVNWDNGAGFKVCVDANELDRAANRPHTRR